MWAMAQEVPTERGILIGTGQAGTSADEALAVFRRLYPGKSEDIDYATVVDWALDRWSSPCEAQISPWFAGIWKFWADEGAPLGFVNPKEGAIAFPLYLQIVKGSTPEQIKVAEDIINELMTPENNSRDAQLTNKIPAFATPTLAQKMDPAFNPKVIDTAIWLDWGVMGQKASEWRSRWEKEVKSRM